VEEIEQESVLSPSDNFVYALRVKEIGATKTRTIIPIIAENGKETFLLNNGSIIESKNKNT
jgi:hypothetical protein